MKRLTTQKGFTIVELMIATTISAVILSGASVGLIRVGQMFYKGVVAIRTQSATRAILDNMSQPIQFSGAQVNAPATVVNYGGLQVKAVCIDNNRYSYALNTQVNDGESLDGVYDAANHRARHGLWHDVTSGPCEPLDLRQAKPSINGEELLGQHMRLKTLNIAEVDDGLWGINLEVIYGDDALITFNDPPTNSSPRQCKTGKGSEWCVVSILSTEVDKRL